MIIIDRYDCMFPTSGVAVALQEITKILSTYHYKYFHGEPVIPA
jgi:hypothetical protein